MTYRYMAVRITICPTCPTIEGAYLYYSDSQLGLELAHNIDMEEATRLVQMMEKRLSCKAALSVNEYDNSISYIDIRGFLDWE